MVFNVFRILYLSFNNKQAFFLLYSKFLSLSIKDNICGKFVYKKDDFEVNYYESWVAAIKIGRDIVFPGNLWYNWAGEEDGRIKKEKKPKASEF